MSSSNRSTSEVVSCIPEVIALLNHAIASLGQGQNAAPGSPKGGPGTTPRTPALTPPGGPAGAPHGGLNLPLLATAQGRAQLYITQPALVRQVETLLDYTAETFGNMVADILERLDEQKSEVQPLQDIASHLRDLATELEAAIARSLESKEKLRQDILRLQEYVRLL